MERAESSAWSSLRRREREDAAFPLLSPWPLPRPADWIATVHQPQTEAELEALRRCVDCGRPDVSGRDGNATRTGTDRSATRKTEEIAVTDPCEYATIVDGKDLL